jgi:diguanylate cyclase (GGDEF)-like protein/PAS domain S-box-containing protein
MNSLNEALIQESAAIIRSFYDSSPMMMGVVEITENDVIHLSDNLASANFFGLTPDAMKNKKASQLGVKSEILQQWIYHYRQSESTASPVRFEYTHKTDRETKWFSATVSPMLLSDGNRSIFSYVVHDITEHKKAQEQLQKVNAQLMSWVKELEERNRKITLLSKISNTLQRCLTVEAAHQTIANFIQLLFPNFSGCVFVFNAANNMVDIVANWGNLKFNEENLLNFQKCELIKHGNLNLAKVSGCGCGLHCNTVHSNSSLASELFCVPMMSQGKALGILYLNSQTIGQFTQAEKQLAITCAEHIGLALANLKLYAELQQQSIRDPLTGLFNRRYLDEFLEREIARANRASKPLAIIMLDVDYFKKFNDKFGHEAGDVVLRELGLFLQKQFRGSDIVCRYGGEELIIILPEISKEAATTRAEFIREGVKNLRINYGYTRLDAISLSLGVACFPEDGLTGVAVIKAADKAMYHAKRLGRDCVVTASQSDLCSLNFDVIDTN